MALITIDYGALASSEVMNNNFSYLNQRISDVSDTVVTNNSSMLSNISTLSNLITEINNSARPVGQPLFRLDNTLFDDEIRLEGDVVSRTTYSLLFQIYGTTYGEGDGSTTFALPNFKNRSIWGASDFGYVQAGLPNVTGNLNPGGGFTANPFGATTSASGAFVLLDDGVQKTFDQSGGNYTCFNVGFDASLSSSVYGQSQTVQPPAIKVRVVTRYK